MAKNNPIIFVVLLVLLVGGGLFLYSKGYFEKFSTFAVTHTQGYQFVQNSNDPTSKYSEILQGGIFTCQYDECIVSGNIALEKASDINSVVFRYSGNYKSIIYVDTNLDGVLEQWNYNTVQQSRLPSDKLDIKTPQGYDIYRDGSSLLIRYTNISSFSTYSFYKYTGSSASTQSTIPSGSCPNTYETCISQTSIFKGEFNFCPTPNYPCCNDAFVTSPSANTFDTKSCNPLEDGLYKLIKGQSLTFTPSYIDGTPILGKNIFVQNYDGSCIQAKSTGTACSPDQSKCIQCPIGYIFYSGSTYCSTLDSVSSNRYITGTCKKSTGCVTPYSYYQKCDGNQTIGASTCGKFSTETRCSSGQKCFLDNGQLGVGLGNCKCANDVCTITSNGIPDRIKETDYSYRECIKNSLGCYEWSETKFCDTINGKQMIFDETLGKCVCNTDNACSSPLATECLNINSYRQCKQYTVGGNTCYYWGEENGCAGTELTCQGSSCQCPFPSMCSVGQVKCLSTTTYQKCQKDVNNPLTTCYEFRGSYPTGANYICENNKLNPLSEIACEIGGILCPTNKVCSNGQCICQTTGDYCYTGAPSSCVSKSLSRSCVGDSAGCFIWKNTTCQTGQECINGACLAVGCAYNPDYACSTAKDKNNAIIESCSANSCVCTSDSHTATISDLGKTRCEGSSIYQANEFIGKTSCYRWELKQSCINDEVCVNNGYISECKILTGIFNIASKPSYAINEVLKNITVQLINPDNQLPRINAIKIEGLLYSGTNATGLKAIATTPAQEITNNEGEAVLDFVYASATPATITLKVSTKDLPNNFETFIPLEIKKTIQIVLSCPVSSFIERDITCTYSIKDATTGTPITDSSNIIEVKDGAGEVLTFTNPVGQIKFKTSIIGSVTISMTSTKDGFITGTAQTITGAQPLAGDFKMLVNNKDYYSYVSGYTSSGDIIETGLHSLDFEVLESGLPMEVLNVDMKITTPSGQDVPLTFSAVSSNKYRASYNFQQPGQTYHLSGTIYPKDRSKADLAVGFALTTKGTGGVVGGTGDTCTGSWAECNLSLIIIIISVFIAIIIIVVVFRRK